MKALVGSERLEQAELLEVNNPAIADGAGEGLRQGRVREQQPASLGYTIGLVIETLGKKLGEIFDGAGAQETGVNRRYAIRAVRANDRQVGHTDLALAAFFDQADSFDPHFVAGKALSHVIQQTPVDLIDDFQVARKQG